MKIFSISLVLTLTIFDETTSEKFHKVHNIVLYPDRHSWCIPTPIEQQLVASPEDEPVIIKNNVCVGTCLSYSIPKTEPAEPGELIRPYCDSCQPSEIKCYHVNLSPSVRKRVQIIVNCSCLTCDKYHKPDCELSDATEELPADLFISPPNEPRKPPAEDVPELLDLPQQNYTTTENEFPAKKDLMKRWFEMQTANASDETSDTKTLNQQDLLDLSASLEAKSKVEGNELDGGEEAHPPHHHLGEKVFFGENVGRLVKGPHGSMIVEPVEAKLHLEPDLEPNDEGVVMAYENHHKRANMEEILD